MSALPSARNLALAMAFVRAGHACRSGCRRHLLHQHREPDPVLRDLRARAQHAGRLRRPGLARPCRPVRHRRLRRRLLLATGYGHSARDPRARWSSRLAATAVFAVLALRATGIGFLMITLALGQIIWGIAYRWISLTDGDNGINVQTRPAPFGIELGSAPAFYYASLVVFLIARRHRWRSSCARRSAQPARHARPAAPHERARLQRLADPLLAFLFSGFWTAVAGMLFVYYNQFISPQVAGADRLGRGAADGDLRRRRRRCSGRSSARPSSSS